MNKKIILAVGVFVLVGVLGFVYAFGNFNVSNDSLQKGLVAHYPLDGENYDSSSGRVTDKSAYSNHGTATGVTLTTDRNGRSNGAMNFGGDGDKIEISSASANEFSANHPMTISYWMKSDGATGSFQATVMKYAFSITYGHLFSNAGNLYVYTDDDSSAELTVSSFINFVTEAGEWIHVVQTYDGDKIYVYKNGEYVAESDSGMTLTTDTTHLLYIGVNSGTGYPFNGDLADIRLYDRALSSTEVSALYTTYRPKIVAGSLQDGLVAHYPLDYESYNPTTFEVTDKSPYNHYGTLQGSKAFTSDQRGRENGALYFDGTGDYIPIDMYYANGDSIPELTVSVWFNSSESGGSYNDGWAFIDFDRSEWYDFYLRPNDGKLGFSGRDGINTYFDTYGNTAVNDGEWHHGALVYDSNNDYVKFYVDGNLDRTVSYADVGPLSYTTTRYGIIGDGSEATSFDGSRNSLYFTGGMSDLRIYHRALSDDEIAQLYGSYRPKITTGNLQKGLVFDMNLREGYEKSSSVMADRTPYGNDGSIVNAVVWENATSFDGSGDYIEVDYDARLDNAYNFTLFVRAKSDTYDYTAGAGFIVDMGFHASSNMGIYVDNNEDMNIRTANDGIALTDAAYDGLYDSWHTYAMTYNGTDTNMTFYVDGVPVDSKLNALGGISDYPLRIGSQSKALGRYFKGNISDVKLYDRPLSTEEIETLHNQWSS